MRPLSRAQTQERTRARILTAARDEFTERGFRDAKIDSIAHRAALTRGAVYSNFSGKRALYFTVLAEDAAQAAADAHRPPPGTIRDALGAFARAWLAGLPLATDPQRGSSRLALDLMPEIVADDLARGAFAQLMDLHAVLLGLALEQLEPHNHLRRVRLAQAVLTTLTGASQLAAAAPGFGDPFDVVRACEHLAGLDLADEWQPPHLPHIPKMTKVDEPWSPPSTVDALRGDALRLDGDGIVAILGLHRLGAIEEALRAAPAGVDVTLVAVTSTPGELLPLTRLALTQLRACLAQSVAPAAWPRLRIVVEHSPDLVAAARVPVADEGAQTALRSRAGRIVGRAEGPGACHAAAVG
jgi:AcrR family transcriptional regulator